MLLGESDGWSLDEPLQIFDSQDHSTTTLPRPNASHATWTWSSHLSPRHDYVVYAPLDLGDAPDSDELTADDYQLWIQDVRSGVFVQRINLLSAAAVTQLPRQR